MPGSSKGRLFCLQGRRTIADITGVAEAADHGGQPKSKSGYQCGAGIVTGVSEGLVSATPALAMKQVQEKHR